MGCVIGTPPRSSDRQPVGYFHEQHVVGLRCGETTDRMEQVELAGVRVVLATLRPYHIKDGPRPVLPAEHERAAQRPKIEVLRGGGECRAVKTRCAVVP